jgi:hypothetical protein
MGDPYSLLRDAAFSSDKNDVFDILLCCLAMMMYTLYNNDGCVNERSFFSLFFLLVLFEVIYSRFGSRDCVIRKDVLFLCVLFCTLCCVLFFHSNNNNPSHRHP